MGARKQVKSIPKWLSDYKITPEIFSSIGEIIMETAPQIPKVHPMLREIVIHLAAQNAENKNILGMFWIDAIVPWFKTAFGSKQQLGFIIAKLLLSEMKTKEEVEKLLSPHLMKSLMSTVGKE